MAAYTKKYEFTDLVAACGNVFYTYHFHPIQEIWCETGVFYIHLDRLLQRPKGNMNINSMCDTSDTNFYFEDSMKDDKSSVTTIFNHVPVGSYYPKYNMIEVLMMVETCLVRKDVECLDEIRNFIRTSHADHILQKRYEDVKDKRFDPSNRLSTKQDEMENYHGFVHGTRAVVEFHALSHGKKQSQTRKWR